MPYNDMNRQVLPIPAPEQPACTTADAWDAAAPERFVVQVPVSAPNVLLVMLDDMGFGASDAFGGPVPMKTASRLAEQGLRFTNFHTTALCAPTRTGVLTGYNHHTNNMGTIPEMGSAFPGNTSIRPKSVTPLARILKENGYATAQFGKCHETPTWEANPLGPFDHWPTSSGFEKFYGFVNCQCNQYHPELFDGITQIPVPDKPGYHLSEDLADQAICWIRLQKEIRPEKPFFVYLAPGATHSPHQAPKDYIDRHKGRFDSGWDAVRQNTLENMKSLGIFPPETKLARKPQAIRDWSALTDSEKRLFARQMEVYAGFAEHVDVQIGRVVDALVELGEFDNTLVIYMLGDNGASAEGLMNGLHNEMYSINEIESSFEDEYKNIDTLGSDFAYNNYSAGWAIAMDAPFTWAKQVASDFGGIRNGLIVTCPARICDRGGIRRQFHHCIDITPTILELAGIPHPDCVDGVTQRPLEGISMAYAFACPDELSRRHTQYFCVGPNFGIYHEGWFAGAINKIPWEKQPLVKRYRDAQWLLYQVDQDPSMTTDVSGQFPAKLDEMKQRFEEEAIRYNVFPIDLRGHRLFDPKFAGRPDASAQSRRLTLKKGMPALRENCFINTKQTSFTITADLEIQDPHRDGVILSQGGRFGGWSLYIHNGRPVFVYNYLGAEKTYVRSDRALADGLNQVELRFNYSGNEGGPAAAAELFVNGRKTAAGEIQRTIPSLYSFDETTCVGENRVTPVTEEYTVQSSRFQGNIFQVTIQRAD